MTTQLWSASHINAHLTGGGTTTVSDTVGGNGVYSQAYGAVSAGSGNNLYWETSATSTQMNTCGQGIGTTASSIVDNDYVGSTNDTLALYGSASNQGLISGAPAGVYRITIGFNVVPGDRLAHALDLVNKLYWVKDITQGSAWYGASNVAGDPAAGTNGFSLTQAGLTFTSNPMVPAANLALTADTVTGYFLLSSWLGVPPSGFGAWGLSSVFSDAVSPCDLALMARSGNEQRVTDWL